MFRVPSSSECHGPGITAHLSAGGLNIPRWQRQGGVELMAKERRYKIVGKTCGQELFVDKNSCEFLSWNRRHLLLNPMLRVQSSKSWSRINLLVTQNASRQIP